MCGRQKEHTHTKEKVKQSLREEKKEKYKP